MPVTHHPLHTLIVTVPHYPNCISILIFGLGTNVKHMPVQHIYSASFWFPLFSSLSPPTMWDAAVAAARHTLSHHMDEVQEKPPADHDA